VKFMKLMVEMRWTSFSLTRLDAGNKGKGEGKVSFAFIPFPLLTPVPGSSVQQDSNEPQVEPPDSHSALLL